MADILRQLEMSRYPFVKEGADPEWSMDEDDMDYFYRQFQFADSMLPTLAIRMKYTNAGNFYFIVGIYEPYSRQDRAIYMMFGPGYRLSEEDEDLLVEYCFMEWALLDSKNLKKIVNTLRRDAPELQVQMRNEDPAGTILNIYYTMFPGIREMLYKTNLPWLALYLSEIDVFNMVASKPAELLQGFSLRSLRLLNNQWGVQRLLTEDKRKTTQEILSVYSKFLGGYKSINASQLEYLKDCHQNNSEIQKNVFRFLKNDMTGNLYTDYVCYKEKASFLNKPDCVPLEVTTVAALYKYSEIAEYLMMYEERKQEFNRKMCKQSKRLSYLDYKGGQFLVTHPCHVEDIIREAEAQNNCLYRYIKKVVNGKADIGFLRKAEAPETPFVTFEVQNGVVKQLLGRFNQKLFKGSEEFQWFTNIYMKEKGFSLFGYE